jgi:flavin-dependent dehydrogenase
MLQNSATIEVDVDGQMHGTRFLIEADGVYSRVCQLTEPDPKWFWRAFALKASVPCSTVEQHDVVFDLATIRDGYGWIFPKAHHLNIGRSIPTQET